MDKRILALVSISYIFNYTAQTDTADTVLKKQDSLYSQFSIPFFTNNGEGAEAARDQQDVSGLLQSSRDVFTQFSGFQFGMGGYRMRGYTAENQLVMINGINVNNPETGYSTWSSWGGLNDVTRFPETRFGNEACRFGFSGPGGYTNIESRAGAFKKGTRFSYSNGNRTYSNRYMITHSTGLQPNGWAFTLSASYRHGNEVYIPGTWFRAHSYYTSIEKRLNRKHNIAFSAFIAPLEQGRSQATTLEAYQIAGSNYYNPSWGLQNGKKRNASVLRSQQPMIMLMHVFNVSDKSRLTSSLFYNFGKTGNSGLTWYKTTNPLPDYYRYLPSHFYHSGDTITGDKQQQLWLENNQVNWDRLISSNQANLYSPPSQGGIITNEKRARYILENRVEQNKNTGFNSVYNTRVKNVFISAGINYNHYQSRKYKEVEDLLGADFWIDLDQFAEQLGVEEFYQLNDIDNPYKKIMQGGRFGYDYALNINKGETWGQIEINSGKSDLYIGFSISATGVYREGFVANGKFPDNSKGRGEQLRFLNEGIKAGYTYKITGRHFLTANAAYQTRTPEINNLYISPRVRQNTISGIKNVEIISYDLNYIVKYPAFKFRLTYYNTQYNNQLWLRTYWHDEYKTNVNLIMKNLNQNHSGIEAGIEKTFFSSHTLQGALGLGRFYYTGRALLEAWQDNNSKELYSGRSVYLKNLRVGGSPQTVMGTGYKYTGRKQWWAGIYINYFDDLFIEPNPDRRTTEATEKYLESEKELAQKITTQEKLPSFSTINLSTGKNWRIKKRYQLNFNLSVNNILNRKNIIISGYEQLRWDKTQPDKFPPRYIFMTGLTFMASLNFNF